MRKTQVAFLTSTECWMPIYIHTDQKVKTLFWHSLHLWSSYPPTGPRKCYWTRDDSWTEPSMAREVGILNGISMRFGEAWPFSEAIDVRYFPLRVKRKGASAVLLPSMGALLNGGVRERRAAVSPPLSLSNVRQNCDKVGPSFISQPWRANWFVFVSFTEIVSPCKRIRDGKCIETIQGMNVQCTPWFWVIWAMKHACLYVCASIIVLFLWFYTAAYRILLYDNYWNIGSRGYDQMQ